ncbi:hypothetical protein CFAM422_011131 [Trichoderma lentiforme]|uniref:Uncharacterized protein n=1 Tax=Trichoderma lentiforme TaxID=1567552 RepID=A0A9P5C7N9_9HYPO|nr:hypothetical protein CFAM422_011131 [Trichoderma lentiforme]
MWRTNDRSVLDAVFIASGGVSSRLVDKNRRMAHPGGNNVEQNGEPKGAEHGRLPVNDACKNQCNKESPLLAASMLAGR